MIQMYNDQKKIPFTAWIFLCSIHTGNIHKNTNNAEFSQNIFFHSMIHKYNDQKIPFTAWISSGVYINVFISSIMYLTLKYN